MINLRVTDMNITANLSGVQSKAHVACLFAEMSVEVRIVIL